MSKFMTMRHLAELVHRDVRTIRRWIEEDRKIMLDNMYFEPMKDPSGHWMFKVIVIAIQQAPKNATND